MNGTEMNYEDFIKEYKDENNNGGSVEITDLNKNIVSEISEKDFLKMIKEEDTTNK